MCKAAFTLFLLLFQVDAEALEWFRKGEELIGTSEEFSERQVEYFRKAVELDPEFAAARFNLALLYLHRENLEAALCHCNELLQKSPQDVSALLLRAQIYNKQGEARLSIGDLRDASQLAPDSHEVWRDLGALLYQEGQLQESLAAYQKALNAQPANLPTCFEMALVQVSLGYYDEAAENCHRVLKVNPSHARAIFLLGVVRRHQDQREEALEYLLKAESISPDDPDISAELGSLYLELGNLKEAEKRLGGDAQGPYSLGLAAKEQQRWEESARYLRGALATESENSVIWTHLGDVLVKQGQLEEAASAYRSAIEQDPDQFNALINLAALYGGLERPDEARELLERAVRLQPGSGLAHLNLALVLESLGQEVEASYHYLAALEAGQDNPISYFRLAILYAKQSKVEEALDHLSLAFEKDPERFVPLVLNELRNVTSDLDSIRYTKRFNSLLNRYRTE